MYNQQEAETKNPYTLEQLEERQRDFLVPEARPVIIDGVDTGYTVTNIGQVYDKDGNRVETRFDQNNYYELIILYRKEGNILTTVHRLVAQAFVPNPDPENKVQVNHINSNRQDNWYKNLEWVTHKENMQHSKDHGFFSDSSAVRVGEDRPNAFHTEEQARQVCEMLEKGMRVGDIMRETGLDRHFVYGILKAGKWKYVSKDYDLKDMTNVPKYTDEQIHQICKYLTENKSNGYIAELMGIPPFVPQSVRNGNLRPDISSQYIFPQIPCRENTRGLPTETVHKICNLIMRNVGPKEICQILPEVPLATVHQIRAKKQYRDVASQYEFPPNLKVKGVRTGRVHAGESKSGMVERLGVGYEYDKVIQSLDAQKQ